MKRIILHQPIDNGYVIFQPGYVIEVEDSVAEAIIARGDAEQAPPGTPCRKDPTGYDSCMPPSPEKLAALKSQKAFAAPPPRSPDRPAVES